MIRRLAAAASCGLLFAAAPASAQVVALVNGAPIRNEQLDRAYGEVLKERGLNVSRMQNPAQARDMKRVALDRLIREELFWQQAQKEKLLATDAEVDKSVAAARAGFPTPAAFEMQLLRQGTDEAGFRAQTRRLLSADRYAQHVVDQRVQVTDEDIEAFHKLNAHLFGKPEMVRVRVIEIAAPAGAPESERRAARLRLEALRQELAGGGDFAQTARQHSDHPTRQWGGELDPVPPDGLPAWMRAPVAKLKPGGLSPVIETTEGYFLLKLDARTPAFKVPLAEVRQSIQGHLYSTRGREALEAAGKELRATAKVEMLVPL